MSRKRTPRRVIDAAAALAGALLLWIIPALLSFVVVARLFPNAHDPFEPTARGPLARLAADHGAAVWAALFLIFALLARHWARHIPGIESARPVSKSASPTRRAVSFALGVVLAGATAVLLRTSVFQSYRVESGSMLPTLAPGSLLAVNKLAYGFRVPGLEAPSGAAPRRGDVVVFRNPDAAGDDELELVKRVVGLPGDRVGVAGGRTVINRWVVPACIAGHYPVVGASGVSIARLHLEFLEDRTYAVLYPMGATVEPVVEYEVRPGEVFVLGDNRAASVDSRSWNRGRGAGLPASRISGRVTRAIAVSDRNGRLDLSRSFEPLGLALNLHGVEAQKLEENVEQCLKLRPKDTRPPPASHAKVSK